MTMHGRLSRFALSAVVFVVFSACAKDAPQADSTETKAMEKGLALLHSSNDPVGAENVFRTVLQHNPSHYGARYQLAVALDRGGRPAEARTEWSEVLRQAQSYGDTGVMAVARARLAAPDTASQGAMMVLGVDLLYRQNNPAQAIVEFQKVLQKNPTHYGATYQLATALDRAQRRSEARPLWQKVLGMATSYKDEATVRAARERLAAP
jgi:Tfp pilus assembly protein PilF